MKPLFLSGSLLALFAAGNLAACNNPPAQNVSVAEGDAAQKRAPAPTTSDLSIGDAAADATPVSTTSIAPKPAPTVTDTFTTPVGTLTVTPIHHASLLLRLGDTTIYVDPAVKDASFEGLPKADYIFITDIHGDHMDPEGVALVKKDDTVIVAPPAVNEKLPAKVILKNGASHDFGAFKVEAVPMYNLKNGPEPGKLFHDKGRGNGYVFTFGKTGAKIPADTGVTTTASRLYISGDTECTPEMKALKAIDVAFVCMNQPYTMTPTEAATCVNAFKPKLLLPYHYRGSNLDELTTALKPGIGTEVRKREWY